MKRNVCIPLLLLFFSGVFGQGTNRFEAVVLGCGGGLEDHNLSAVLLGEENSGEFLCLDAGTLYSGINIALGLNNFPWFKPSADDSLMPAARILRNHIKAYLISHAHIDHITGLVIASPDDISKPVLGLPPTIEDIVNHVFNWRLWPNFGNEGKEFSIGKYQYIRLEEAKEMKIPGTFYFVTAFALSHSNPYQSTAFLIRKNDSYILYCGDTGADAEEGTHNLEILWKAIAPLVASKKLKAVFLECSYSNQQPSGQMYGHFNPRLLMEELHKLALLADEAGFAQALGGMDLVITHIKPSIRAGSDEKKIIASELEAGNDLGLNIIIARQGERIIF